MLVCPITGHLMMMVSTRFIFRKVTRFPPSSALVNVTKYHRLYALNDKQLFLILLEAGKSRIKAQADPVSGESPRPALPMTIFSLYSHIKQS